MRQSLAKCTLLAIGISVITTETAVGLPPANDIPEEVLRTEVITGAQSPIDGRPLTASEYAVLQAQLRTPQTQPAQVSQEVKELIRLLRLRKIIKTIIPFFPIK